MDSQEQNVDLLRGPGNREWFNEGTWKRGGLRGRNLAGLVGKSLAALILLSCAQLAQGLSDDARRVISIEDQFAFSTIGSVNLSPNDKWIAYTVETPRYEDETTHYQIFVSPVSGGDPIAFTEPDHSSWHPVFSRDGSALYFLSDREGTSPQVWRKCLSEGMGAKRLTSIDAGVTNIRFSSDETKLLLVQQDKDRTQPLVEGSDPWVIDRLSFKKDYVGYLGQRREHVYVYDLNSLALKQITFGDFDDGQPAWSPDDKQVAFVSNRGVDGTYDTDIWIVSADGSGEPQKLTSNTGADDTPVWHRDGQWIVTRSSKAEVPENYAVAHLTKVAVATGEQLWLTDDLNRNIFSPAFQLDDRYLYFLIEDSGEQQLGRLEWASHESVERLTEGPQVVSEFDVTDDGQFLFVSTSSDRPQELFRQFDEVPSQLSGINSGAMSALQLGQTEDLWFAAPDGLPLHGFVTLPPDYKPEEKFPAITLIHGGPVSQYDHGFSFEAQFLAANGYVVIRTNPRGSSGYGESFSLALWQGWGEKDYRDVLAGVDHVIKKGYADPDSLGVGGYSYGGILTNYLLGHTDRFKAAVSGAGSGHYLASYGHDEYRYWYESELGLPWENRQLWERLSPFSYIHRATTPTLFYGGELDWNVPIQGSEQLYQVMRRVGVETRLVVYPDEHHGEWRFANERDAMLRTLGWFDKFLKSTAGTE